VIRKLKIHGYRLFKEAEIYPNNKLNIIVGANESGKTTILEALTLALTNRINGRRAREELNPFWFNMGMVSEFLDARTAGTNVSLPEIFIEVYFDNDPELMHLCGAANSAVPTEACPGISLRIFPDSRYEEEIEEWLKKPSKLMPVDFYKVDWRHFGDQEIGVRPKGLATAIIDSSTVRSTTGIDYHLRDVLNQYLEPKERATVSASYRELRGDVTEKALGQVNKRIAKLQASLDGTGVSLEMDQTSRASWENTVSPHVEGVPFSMSGHGQQAAIKISLAMNRHRESANFITIEEPENHLSHTSLRKLIERIERLAGEDQQLFITTHSSFVLNRLGLDQLILIGDSEIIKTGELDPDTASYFKKMSGYDSLRLVLGEKLVIVEGPSDEIIFERVFNDLFGCLPMDQGIDVFSARGLSHKRCLELCSLLGKKVAATRDNDGFEVDELVKDYDPWLKAGQREMFIGHPAEGHTLEPQIISHNEEKTLRNMLRITERADTLTWMSREKTEAALRISCSEEVFVPPKYLEEAAKFIHG
jgi:energy-coupling factor transporter ATP-binding protein EcfA2